jgi:hypothetical protein
MMNEKSRELIETLKVLRSLQADGMKLHNEIMIVVRMLLTSQGITKDLLNKVSEKQNSNNK